MLKNKSDSLPTVTIGIPAFNEEANIKELLLSLLSQKADNYKLKKIIVVSDGSTDKTVKRVKEITDSKVDLIELKKRVGVNLAQNEILRLTNEDILVIVNADVLPANDMFIEEIIEPISKDKSIGIVGGNAFPMQPKNSLERFLASSHHLKQYMFKRINKGNNIYLCNGKARAFSKEFYTQLRWPDNCPEDAYSYMACIKNGFKFAFAKKAYVKFRCPKNIRGHIKQSNRYIYGKKKLEELFPKEFLYKEYYIPKTIILYTLMKFLITRPISTFAYLFLNAWIRLMYKIEPKHHSRYDIVTSSKKVTI